MPRRTRRTIRYRRHVGGRQFTTLNRFRAGIAFVFDLSLNSFVWQFALLYLLIIGSSSTTDRLIGLK